MPISSTPCKTTRIALVSDTHTNFGLVGEQPGYAARLATVIAEVNAANTDIVLVAGDLTENGTEAEFEAFARQSQAFLPHRFVVPGNHDVGGKCLPNAPDSTTAVTPERVQRFEMRFGPSFWKTEIAGIRLIGLNSLVMGCGFAREQEQWAFLEEEFTAPSPLPTVVVLHQPPFLHRPDEPGGDYWNVEPEPRDRLLRLLSQGGVTAVLSGHIHRPLQLQESGIAFITTPPVAFGLPPESQPEGWTLVTMTVPSSDTVIVTAEIRYIPA